MAGGRAGGRIGGWAGCGLREIACLLFAPLLIAPPCALHPSTFDLLIPASASAPAPCSAGKSHRELAELESGIQEQLDSGAAADPEYWQAVLKRLHLHKAKARLRELHAGGWRAGWGVGVTAAPVCLRAGAPRGQAYALLTYTSSEQLITVCAPLCLLPAAWLLACLQTLSSSTWRP